MRKGASPFTYHHDNNIKTPASIELKLPTLPMFLFRHFTRVTRNHKRRLNFFLVIKLGLTEMITLSQPLLPQMNQSPLYYTYSCCPQAHVAVRHLKGLVNMAYHIITKPTSTRNGEHYLRHGKSSGGNPEG